MLTKTLGVVTALAAVVALAGCGSSPAMMPNVTGDQLDYAKTQIEKQGIDEKDIQVVGGGTFGVVIESNWLVCNQSPQANQSLENAKVTLTVSRSCMGSGVPLN